MIPRPAPSRLREGSRFYSLFQNPPPEVGILEQEQKKAPSQWEGVGGGCLHAKMPDCKELPSEAAYGPPVRPLAGNALLPYIANRVVCQADVRQVARIL